MSLVSPVNVSLEEKRAALNGALDERTDPIRLRQCVLLIYVLMNCALNHDEKIEDYLNSMLFQSAAIR